MGRIVRRPLAEDDLVEIWLYIARDNPAAADRVTREFEAALDRLSEYPRSGRPRPELLAELRSASVRPYILFYLPLADGIEPIRVPHGARDLDAVVAGG